MSENEYSRRLQAELDQLNDPGAKYQQILDRWIAGQRDAQRDDRYVEIGGFRERRRSSCHVGKTDSDYGQH